jgi:hypothetical protein
MKRIFGLPVHRIIELYILWSLAHRRLLCTELTRREARAHIKSAIERYSLWWTLIVALAYALGVWGCSGGHWWATTIAVLCCAIRLFDIVAVNVRLIILERYATDTLPHAFFLHVLAIGQAVICFAVFYCADSFATGDAYSDSRRLTDDYINALYFSVVTFVTLGYGDFAPRLWSGKALVLLEIVVGIGLIVVTIQRTLTGSMDQLNEAPDKTIEERIDP